MSETKTRENLKLRRGYGYVNYLLRASGVSSASRGRELLENAIMYKLINPTADINATVDYALNNLSVQLNADFNGALYFMKEALDTVKTKHPEKLLLEEIVWRYICNISNEVRVREYIKTLGCNISPLQEDALTAIAMRVMNPARRKDGDTVSQTMEEIISWVAGKIGYDSGKQLEEELSRVIDEEDIADYIYNIIVEKEKLVF